MRVVAITGGAGFVGRRLAASLLDDAGLSIQEVRLLDVRAPAPIPFAPSSERLGRHEIGQGRLAFVKCDLTSASSVSAALNGVDTVFHLASYGMSGREMLDVKRVRQVNVDGTRHVIDACRSLGVARLLYCSTYNTVFGTSEIIDGDEEKVPYYPLGQFHDEYSRTKRIAEEMVREANSETLSTCALRPAAIYGDGEERHLPRILNHVRLGLGLAGIGSPSTLCDWVYVDNLAHALILAASSLTLSGSRSLAAGSAYCISDARPMNNFAFLKPICVGLGYTNVFRFYVPTSLMFYLAWLLELLRLLLLLVTGGRVSFQPLLTRSEVMKVGVTHFFSMSNARRDIGYAPIVTVETAIERCIEYYRDEFATNEAKRDMRNRRTRKTSIS